MNPQIEAQLRLSTNFPSPPGVASHIIQLAQDPDIEMGKVAKAVSMDPALTTKILRIANSALYAQRRKSENLRQALVVLGLNATLTLALSFSLVKSLRQNQASGLDYPRYWRRSLFAATAARALADALRQPRGEDFFLAALLQDVGMLALDRAFPDLYADTLALQQDHSALAQHEFKRKNMDHADVGAWAMRKWNLPTRICAAIANSHKIDLEPNPDAAAIMDRCVALSGEVAQLFLAEPDQRHFAEVALAVERGVALDKAAFGQVLATIGAIIPETEAIFDARLLSKLEAELILEQAHEVLLVRSLQALRGVHSSKVVAERSYSRTLDLQEEHRRDALTGTHNRADFDQFLQRAFANASRQGYPLSVAFADLDNFKAVKDTFGHQAGDRILQTTAQVLRDNTRETDYIARYAGEQFVMLLPATDAATAQRICERIVCALQSMMQEVGEHRVPMSLSIGCSTQAPGSDFANASEFVKAADQALYSAQMRGRNRAVPYDSELPQALTR